MEDLELFEQIYKEHATGIQRMCFLYLGDLQMAEDAMQETFIKVFRYYDNFQRKSSIKTWITRIAINVCKDMLAEKKEKHYYSMTDEEFTAQIEENSHADGLSVYRQIEEKMVLTAAINGLEEKYKDVVVLFYYQELSTKEIAQIMEIPRTTVEFRLKRARIMLGSALKGVSPDGKLEESAGY